MLTRKQFIQATASGFAAAFVGCGDSAGTGGAGGTATTTSTSGSTTKAATTGVTTSGATSSSKSGSSTSTASTGTGQSLTCSAPAVAIGSNHPVGSEHKMTVAMADVAAGVDKTYDIMGNSLHTHSVTLTAADFAALKATGTTMAVSTTASMHSHPITVTCAS